MKAIERLDPSWNRWTRAAKDVQGSDVPLLIRGEHRNEGPPTPRGWLTAINASDRNALETVLPESRRKSSGRLWLAEQIVHPANPLTSRVWANRIWHHLFGRGIVATPNNFGLLGAKPTHRELLDFLAQRLVDQNWSTKKLIREIVFSRAYQRTSQIPQSTKESDPENKFLSYHSRRRLNAEQLRDAMLAVSGSIDLKMHGPSVDVFVPPYATANKPSNIPVSGPLDGGNRRSIYIKVRRSFFDPFLRTFDFPNPGKSIGKRIITVAPTQSLAMLNSPLVHELSGDWARVIPPNTQTVDDRCVAEMWNQALGRSPTSQELAIIHSLFADLESLAPIEKKKQVAHLLFNHPEFMWID